jgi:hypothetical protein
MHRLTRPAFEWLAAAGHRPGKPPDANIASALLAILPPKSLIWSFRLRQYLNRLENSWRHAALSEGIVIVDQGFVQAVCSLLLLGRSPDRSLAERALTMIPHADLLLRLNAPPDVLRARLETRRRGQSWIEHLFELDIETSLRTVEILDMLGSILRERDQRVANVDCGDRWSWPGTPDELEHDGVANLIAGAGAYSW